MAVLDSVTVGGTDYTLQDTEGRNILGGTIQLAQSVHAAEHTFRELQQSFYWNIPENRADNTFGGIYGKGECFFWNSFNFDTPGAEWYPQGLSMRTTKAVTSGELIQPGVNCEPVSLKALMSNIKTYVGGDGKIHFTDVWGADSALNFNGSGSPFGYFPRKIFATGFTSGFSSSTLINAPSGGLTIKLDAITWRAADGGSGQVPTDGYAAVETNRVGRREISVGESIILAPNEEIYLIVGTHGQSGGVVEATFSYT